MAETVKKSRIVSESDENLEESLLEEFNLRLKKCMSRDDLRAEDEPPHVYENAQINRENGERPSTPNHHSNSCRQFLDKEREHYGHSITTNGHTENHDDLETLAIENSTNLECSKTDSCLDQSMNGTIKSCEPSLSLPITCFTDLSGDSPPQEAESADTMSAKNRMFLSTDDASCLLFTQTVTSPMLTPSEENIDFLKGFRRESSQNTLSDDTNSSNSPKSNRDKDGLPAETVAGDSVGAVDVKEPVKDEAAEAEGGEDGQHIYENADFIRELADTSPTDDDPLSNNDGKLKEANGIEAEPRLPDLKESTLQFIRNETHTANHRAPEYPNDLPSGNEHITEENLTVESATAQTEKACRNLEGEDVSDIPTDSVKNLKTHFMRATEGTEPLKSPRLETSDELDELKSLNIMRQISKFENKSPEEVSTNVCTNFSVSTVTESRFVETTTETQMTDEASLKKKKSKKSKNQHEKENISVTITNNTEESFYNVNVKNLCRSFGDLTQIEREVRGADRGGRTKSSFSKFDALQKKNAALGNQHEQENGGDACRACGRPVFHMERIVAARHMWHRNCFRCRECSKQLLVDNFESHEGVLYCKPHFKALFMPKAVEEDEDGAAPKSRKYEIIIRENQPAELPPDVVRASDKPDLGLEELHSLNVKERFQVFENAKSRPDREPERNPVRMERSPSILSKLARFQARGMDVGVADDSLSNVPVEFSDSEGEQDGEEEVGDGAEGEDADLVRAKRVQKEKPFHFVQMSDVKSKWEQGNQLQNRDERREERKQEIQNIRSRLFHGKQGKMKEAYQQAIAESETKASAQKEVPVEAADTRSIKDKFERGQLESNELRHKETEDMSIFESGIGKQSRSIFQELDAGGGKPLKISPSETPKLGNAVRNAREAYLAKQASEDTVRSSDQVDEVVVRTADIQDRFKFFETYKEPRQERREFRMTPPREGQMKSKTPEREVRTSADVVRADDYVEDSVVAKATHTATKMLSKFRQMEEDLQRGQEPQGLKPMKRFTPPREPARRESSGEEESGSEEEEEEDGGEEEANRHRVAGARMHERDLLEAQKAARAKQLKAKFERWEETTTETRRDSSVNLAEEVGDSESQIETAKSLRAKFESLQEPGAGPRQSARVKVNRFVETEAAQREACQGCRARVYPLERTSVHGRVFHKSCFRCRECNAVLRMDSYSYNGGFLYCTTHFKRLFMSKGNYDTAFGLQRPTQKWNSVTTLVSR